jgi:hypothetical protein
MVFTMPPLLYVFAIGYKVKKRKILPLKGHTRVLALYFMRIIVIFVTFYIPMLVLANAVNFISPGPNDPIKANYFVTLQVFRLLFPIQNIVTFKLLLEKKDISDALYDYTAQISSFFFVKPSDRDFTDPTNEISEWEVDDIYCHDTDGANDVIDIEHPTVDQSSNDSENMDTNNEAPVTEQTDNSPANVQELETTESDEKRRKQEIRTVLTDGAAHSQ